MTKVAFKQWGEDAFLMNKYWNYVVTHKENR